MADGKDETEAEKKLREELAKAAAKVQPRPGGLAKIVGRIRAKKDGKKSLGRKATLRLGGTDRSASRVSAWLGSQGSASHGPAGYGAERAASQGRIG